MQTGVFKVAQRMGWRMGDQIPAVHIYSEQNHWMISGIFLLHIQPRLFPTLYAPFLRHYTLKVHSIDSQLTTNVSIY